MEDKPKKILSGKVLAVLNAILILGLIVAFICYDNSNEQQMYEKNVDDISNINQASANIAEAFFSSREAKLRDLALQIEKEGMTLQACMDYIYDSNSDEGKAFELVGADCTGYRIQKDGDGAYAPVNYSNGYGTLSLLFQNERSGGQAVEFVPEFTDSYTAMKSFALYIRIHLIGEDGASVPYTLMVVSKTADFISMINIDTRYEKLSSALIGTTGDYIIRNSEFKSDNFFRYLALFNDLTLDQQNAIEAQVAATGKGFLAYRDGRGRDSVFVYAPVAQKDWYCVTAVPTDSFGSAHYEFAFSLVVVLVMLALLTMDMCYFSSLNRRLKRSAENERIANAAKSEFLSRMSHDMRTPMNGIIGMTRLTQDIPGLPDEVRSNLDSISDASGYLLQLINDALDMSKIESRRFTLHPEIIDVREFVGHIIATVRPMTEQKRIELEFVPINAKLESIRADRMRVQQIFINILSNAVKFTPQGGKIRIEVETLSRENGRTNNRISIEDNGCGMSEEFQKHIFEPFSQENTKIVQGQEGTGLGMAIVKNLTELMGGHIEIESKPGAGTKVTVYLSFECVDDVGDAPKHEMGRERAELSGKRVLLAEDHPLNAAIARRLLDKKGVCTDHAENGAEAVRMFSASECGYYDAVLMDVRMPELDGLEATRRIRALDRRDAKTVPIIAMTANAYAEDIQAATDAGMNAHMAKPIEPELLYKMLGDYL